MSGDINAEGVDNQPSDGVESTSKSDDQPPKWFQEFAEKVEGKFKQVGQDFGRLRGKIKDEGAKPAETPEQNSLTKDDVMSLVRDATELGAIKGSLAKEAREALDTEIEGLDPGAALKIAKLAIKFQPTATDGAPEKPGQARSPKPPSQTPAHAKTLREFVDIRRKAAEGDKAAQAQADAMTADPDFDPMALPRR